MHSPEALHRSGSPKYRISILEAFLLQPDVFGMILNLGGSSVMTYGETQDGSSWKVALTETRDTEGD